MFQELALFPDQTCAKRGLAASHHPRQCQSPPDGKVHVPHHLSRLRLLMLRFAHSVRSAMNIIGLKNLVFCSPDQALHAPNRTLSLHLCLPTPSPSCCSSSWRFHDVDDLISLYIFQFYFVLLTDGHLLFLGTAFLLLFSRVFFFGRGVFLFCV